MPESTLLPASEVALLMREAPTFFVGIGGDHGHAAGWGALVPLASPNGERVNLSISCSKVPVTGVSQQAADGV